MKHQLRSYRLFFLGLGIGLVLVLVGRGLGESVPGAKESKLGCRPRAPRLVPEPSASVGKVRRPAMPREGPPGAGKPGKRLKFKGAVRVHIICESVPVGLFVSLYHRDERGALDSRGKKLKPSRRDFEFSNLRPGHYGLSIGRLSQGVEFDREITVTDEAEVVQCSLGELQTNQWLEVEVLGVDPSLLRSATFSLSSSESEDADLAIASTQGRRLKLVLPSLEDLDCSEQQTLSVSIPELGSTRVPFFLGQSLLTIQFSGPRILRIAFENKGEDWLGRIDLSLRGDSHKQSLQSWGLEPVTSDLCQESCLSLTAELVTGMNDKVFICRRDLVLQEGFNEVLISIPKFYSLDVSDISSSEGALTLTNEDRSYLEQTDGKGRIRFSQVLEGTYWLSDSSRRMKVRIPSAKVIHWPSKPVIFRVEIDKEGALSRCGFENGDRIIGFAGKRFKALGHDCIEDLLNEAQQVFMVERGSRIINIEARFSEVLQLKEHLGGSVETFWARGVKR